MSRLICWFVPASVLFVVWLAAVTVIFAQTMTTTNGTASTTFCLAGDIGCACELPQNACVGAAVCSGGLCVAATSALSSMSSSGVALRNGTSPAVVAHEMTLLGVSMALSIVLVVLYWFFIDRPAARGSGYARVGTNDEFSAAVDADTDNEL
jgi:hypothetical protein